MTVLRRLGNPLTSEAAAFRWLVAVAILVALVTAVALALG